MFRTAAFVFGLLCVLPLFASDLLVLFDASVTGPSGINPRNSNIRVDGDALLIESGPSKFWPGFNMGRRDWNLSEYDSILLDVTNLGDVDFTLHVRLDTPEADLKTMKGTITQSVHVKAGETKSCEIDLPFPVDPKLHEKFFGMRTNPDGRRVHGQKTAPTSTIQCEFIVGMSVFLNQPTISHRWKLRKIVAVKDDRNGQFPWMKRSVDEFFPMVDRFGQFKHKQWPGKIRDEKELKAAIDRENDELARHPAPKGRNRFGGDAEGPEYEATGHFRVEKIDGFWWLIDPDGCRFWSHGMDCVRIMGEGDTPIDGREFYYEELPSRDDPLLKTCYGRGNWAVSNWYYQEHTPFTTVSFMRANLIRKFGPTWQDDYRALTLRRLDSWGFNTIANWSERKIYETRTMPYTVTIGVGGKRIEGSSGYWGKFPDPFSTEFENNIRHRAEQEQKLSAEDPWCLGYYVDNELSWGPERSLSLGAITSSADQPAKRAFVDELKKKYGDIARLNDAWGTRHADWNALLQAQEKPDENKAGKDLDDFHRKVCEKYFRTIRDALKKAAPNKLYLGCRFAWQNETAVRVSAEFCDVVSFNIYKRSTGAFKLPDGIDKPVIIGEFSFAATDVGFFDRGLVNVVDQKDRGDAYEEYVVSALEHPNFIGAHWFQLNDYSVTGRGDSANVQAGFIDVCDNPYAETVRAARNMGRQLYEIRAAAQKR